MEKVEEFCKYKDLIQPSLFFRKQVFLFMLFCFNGALRMTNC